METHPTRGTLKPRHDVCPQWLKILHGFTDAQRELFQRVANTIRSSPSRAAEAGRWLDTGADLPAADDRVKRTRDYWLAEVRSRRQVGRSMGRESGRAYLVPMEGRTLMASRAILAGRIRDARATAVSKLSQYEIIEAATSVLLGDPPNYDALRPDLAEQSAWRVLLVVWILTDPHPLATKPKVTHLQAWEWGEHQLEFLSDWPEERRPIPRLYARVSLLDPHMAQWEQLARDALRVVDVTSGEPAAVEGPAKQTKVHRPAPTPNHSADFTFVNWFGTEYTFALGVQSSAVQALWEEWESTGLGLHQDTIRNTIDAERDNFRMDTAFRNHPAFGTMIRRFGDGKYRLVPPGAEPPTDKTRRKKSAGITSKSRRKRG